MGSLSPPQGTQAELDTHVADVSVHSSGFEVAARADDTAGAIAVSSGGATTTDVVGCVLTFATGDRPVLLRGHVPAIAVTSLAGSAFVDIEADGSLVAREQSSQAYAANRAVAGVTVEERIPAGTASKTYQLTLYGVASALTCTTSATSPAWLHAVEI